MQGKSLSACWHSPMQCWLWSGCPAMWVLPTLGLPHLGRHLGISLLRGLEGPAASRSVMLSLLPSTLCGPGRR